MPRNSREPEIGAGWQKPGLRVTRTQSGFGLSRANGSHAEPPLQRGLHTHLQERVDLLLLLPIHISFLKELEVGDEAPTWSDMPTRNVLRWVPRRWMGIGLRNERKGQNRAGGVGNPGWIP